jgi:hypothetical protein
MFDPLKLRRRNNDLDLPIHLQGHPEQQITEQLAAEVH